MKKTILFALIILLSGCKTLEPDDIAKLMVPANVVGSYFASTGLHESGHALAAKSAGATWTDIDIRMVPVDGKFAITRVEFPRQISNSQKNWFFSAGPIFQYGGHVLFRELVKTGYVTPYLQPTLGWFEMFNQIGSYYHMIGGIMGVGGMDLSKTDDWIPYALLGGALLYDIYDILDDGIMNRVKLLFGEYFYDSKENNNIKPVFHSSKDNQFLGIRFDW